MLEKIGRDIPSTDYWAGKNREYADAIEGDYHRHRLAMIRSLIAPMSGGTVLDFGAGDGVMLLDFPNSEIIGIEPDPGLTEIARQKVPAADFHARRCRGSRNDRRPFR
ncbi:MAG: hypothetical protein WKF52_00420 [Sphingomicrobium sp.]